MKYFTKKTAAAAGAVLLAGGFASGLAGTAHADDTAQSHGIHVTGTGTHSVTLAWRGVGQSVPDEVQVYNPSTMQQAVHTAFELNHSSGRTVDFGTGFEGKALAVRVDFEVDGRATGWSQPVTFYADAAGGLTGAAGPKGDKGDQGPSGVVDVTTVNLPTTGPVDTGGSFNTNAKEAGTAELAKGTYLVTLNAKASPRAATAGDVFPQFFVYNQEKNADFDGDLFNVGSGALENPTAEQLGHKDSDGSPDPDVIDSYYSGSQVITLPEDTTLHVYAFGYDSDSGGGSYLLDSGSLTIVQLTPAAPAAAS